MHSLIPVTLAQPSPLNSWQQEFDTTVYSQSLSPGGSTRPSSTGPRKSLMFTTVMFVIGLGCLMVVMMMIMMIVIHCE